MPRPHLPGNHPIRFLSGRLPRRDLLQQQGRHCPGGGQPRPCLRRASEAARSQCDVALCRRSISDTQTSTTNTSIVSRPKLFTCMGCFGRSGYIFYAARNRTTSFLCVRQAPIRVPIVKFKMRPYPCLPCGLFRKYSASSSKYFLRRQNDIRGCPRCSDIESRITGHEAAKTSAKSNRAYWSLWSFRRLAASRVLHSVQESPWK